MRKGWEYKKLGEVCDITMGQSPNGNSINEANGVEFHQGKTCFGERFLGVSPLYSNAPTKLAEAHSVLLCVRAPVGYPNITDRKICIGRGLCALYAKGEIDNTFLYYSLLGKQSYFEKNATGSTFKAISSKIVSNTTLSIPPLSTQLAIVSELDKINELIRLKKEQLKDFDNLAQSLFYEMFGDPVENEMGWEVKKLNDICDVRDGTHDSPKYLQNSEYILITSKNIVNGSIDFENVNYISEEDYIKINKRSKVDNGDIIMPMIGTIGKPIIAHIDETHKFCIKNVALIKFLADSTVSNMFIVNLMRCSSFSSYLLNQNKGGTQKFVALGAIRKLPIPLPPLSLQRLFAQRIEQIEREKSEVQKSILDLETLLASRMQYWFE